MLGKSNMTRWSVLLLILCIAGGCTKETGNISPELLYAKLQKLPQSDQYNQWRQDYIIQNQSLQTQNDLIVFTGSSTIALWKSMQADFSQYNVVNRHFSGCYIEHLIRNLDVIALDINPAALVAYIGDNDMFKTSVKKFFEYADCLLYVLQQRHPALHVIFLSVKPSPARKELYDQYRHLNLGLQNLAYSNSGIDFIDIWTPMLLKSGDPDETLFLQDGTHLNATGYAVIKAQLDSVFQKLSLPSKTNL